MRNYETFSTTADTGIRFMGRDFRELYGNALRGLNLLLFGANLRSTSGCDSAPFAFRGDGPENVLVNFLSEALAQVYGRQRRVAAAVFRRASRSAIDVRLLLAPCRRPPKVDIKSVTYHNLRVEKKNGVMRVAIVFDI